MKQPSWLELGVTKTRPHDKYNDKSHNKRTRRVAVITGSGKGIGKSIALGFAKAGYSVMINDLEPEEQLKKTAEEISQVIGDNRIGYVIGDVSREQASISLIEQTIKKFGRIDVLINNAAIAEKTDETVNATTNSNLRYQQASRFFTLEEYEVADANLKGAYFCIRQALKRINSGIWSVSITEKSEYLHLVFNIL